jgi:hypothetical protein
LTPTASIVIPTRARPDYLEVALASIAPQARDAGAELLVVEDGQPSPELSALAERFGAAHLSHPRPLGLNAARNTGIANSHGELLVFVDDDVEVRPGWLRALLSAAREHPHTQVFTGPIRPRLEGRKGWSRHSCGREGPPITSLDLGPQDTDRVRFAWGANLTVRRSALERVGPFDDALGLYGDEQEWQERLLAETGMLAKRGLAETGMLSERGMLAAGECLPASAEGERLPDSEESRNGRKSHSQSLGGEARQACGASAGAPILYVAAAALDHRRSPEDARLRSLARAARARGGASPRYDAWRGEAPSLRRELLTLAGCVGHVVRRRCPAGLTMVAHSLGRLEQGVRERRHPTRRPPTEDFLSGESGTVGGVSAVRREASDLLIDARELLSGRRLRLDRAARRSPPRRSVLVLGVERPERRALAGAIRAELERSRHEVEVRFGPPGELGKFQNLNQLVAAAKGDEVTEPARTSDASRERGGGDGVADRDGIEQYDWLLVVDDDVVLPRHFLDHLLFLAERFDFQLVQPAHRARSHAAWRITRRRAGAVARQTPFVEIGPVTAFARATFGALLPFPDVRMGWGLDLHWAALAREHGWRCGVLDAVAIRHSIAPAGEAYSRAAAVAEARTLLSGRPYLKAAEAQTTIRAYPRW